MKHKKKMTVKKVFFFGALLMFLFSTNITNAQEKKEDYVKFGGAVRYNIIHQNYESDPTTLNTKATWDTWRLNVNARTAGVDLDFEYRFYPTFGTHFIHHGWLGYGLSDKVYMKLGACQVPFGITKYASHSWWFQGPYYVGLEDDYDMGIKFDINPTDKLELNVAYFRQTEPEGPFTGNVTWGNVGPGRYSYDITPGMQVDTMGTTASIRELNQANLRATYDIAEGIEIGASAQVGGIYNSVLDEAEMSNAMAGHVYINKNGWNFKGEYVMYDYAAKDDAGNDLELIQVGAYGLNNNIAAKANMIVAGLGKSIDVDLGPISNIMPYVDYTVMTKEGSMDVGGEEYDFANSQMLVPGFLITAGSIYTYVDFAMGKNQPWLTDSFGVGMDQGHLYQGTDADGAYYTDDAGKVGTPVPTDDMDWNYRFNINLGYYF